MSKDDFNEAYRRLMSGMLESWVVANNKIVGDAPEGESRKPFYRRVLTRNLAPHEYRQETRARLRWELEEELAATEAAILFPSASEQGEA